MRMLQSLLRGVGLMSCAALLASCDSDGGTRRSITGPGPEGVEPRIGEVSGNNQQAEVATAVPAVLALRVQDQAARPVAGTTVTWTVTGGDGRVSSAATTTGADGRVSVQWVLGRVAGAQTVSATVSGLEPVVFTAQALAGRTASVALAPTPVVLPLGGRARVQVIVRDAFGNLITGRPISLRSAEPAVAAVSAEPGAGSAESMAASVLAARAGTTVVSAESEGVTGSIVVSVTDDSAGPVLTAGSGDGQTGAAGQAARDPLVARLVMPGGTAVAGRSVRFAVVSGGGSVDPATATTDANGAVSARFTFGPRAGTQVVSASVDGLPPISFNLNAVAGPATRVVVQPATVTLQTGGTTQLAVSATDVGGNPVSSLPMYTSANPAVATVSASGVVRAVGPGSTTVTVQVDGTTANVPVVVASSPSAPVSTVTITPSPVTVYVGETVRITIVARDAAGTVIPGAAVTVTTSNSGVATVTPEGAVTGVGAGTAEIAVTVGGVTTRAQVTVAARPNVGSVTITPSPAVVRVGATLPLTIVARGPDGSQVSGVSPVVTSSNPAVASVNAQGVVTGVAAGTATVTATVNGVSATVLVTVTQVSTVSISPNPVTLSVGASVPLVVTARDGNGAALTGLPATLASTNPAIVRVNADGSVTGVAVGTAEVTATVAGVTARVTVTVNPAVTTVTISPSPVTLTVGASVPLVVTARSANGTAITGLQATLSSSNSSVVRVNADGSITGIAAGTAEVTATVAGVSARVTVTVNAAGPPVSTVTISPSPVTLSVGASVPLVVTARSSNGTVLTGLQATLASSNPNVVRVNADGSITGIAAGTAEVTATVGGVTARVTVTVTAAVSTVTISPSPVTISVGASVPLVVTARSANGAAITGLQATLASSNSSVVRVNADGSITGIAAGTAEVTATVGGVTARVTVTVTAAVSTVTISPSPVTISVGASLPLVVTARSANGTAITGLQATLASSNSSVVRVNADGSITGIAAGTAEVTATVGGVTARVTVTVTAAVSTVTISPSPVTISVGASLPLMVTARSANGTAITGLQATLASTNSSVVRVNADGSITGIAAGTAEVTATVGGVTARVTVTVTAAVSTVTISPSPVILTVGASVPLVVTARSANGTALTGLQATLASSNPGIVRVNANGSITGVAAGTAEVTATVGGVTARATVTVTPPVATVAITPSPVNLTVGASTSLTVTVRAANGTVITGLPVTLASANPSIVRVNADGTITGVALGSAEVTATVAGVSARVTVNVSLAVATISIIPSPITISVGASLPLAITARAANGTILAGLQATLASSNPNIVRVNVDGTITGIAAGTAEVTATILGITARATVTVLAPVATVSISPSPITLTVGASLPLTVTSRAANGTILAGLQATLASSNSSIVRVNANGTITAIAAGTAEVTATVAGITARVTVTVNPPQVGTVEVTPATVNLRVGGVLRLNITVRDLLGGLLSGLNSTLSSSNPLVAIVAPDGTITGLLPGTAEVTVTVGGVTTRVPVRVTL